MSKRFSRNTVQIKDISKYDKELGTNGDFYLDKHQAYVFTDHQFKKITGQAFTASQYPDPTTIPPSELYPGDIYVDSNGKIFIYNGQKFVQPGGTTDTVVSLDQANPTSFKNSNAYFSKTGKLVTMTIDVTTLVGVNGVTVPIPTGYAPVTNGEIRIWTSWRPSNNLTTTTGDGSTYLSLKGGNLCFNNLTANYNHTATVSYITQ